MSKKRANRQPRKRVPGTVTRRPAEHRRTCLIVGDEDEAIVSVKYYPELDRGRRSGLLLFTPSAPPSHEECDEDDISSYCLACTSEKHPEAERGLMLARAYGFAWWDDDEGCWLAQDKDGNEVLFDAGDETEPR